MSKQFEDCTGIQKHLYEALETAENSETRYQIREALQKTVLRSEQVRPAAAFDD